MKAIACKFKISVDSSWEFGIAVQTANDPEIVTTRPQ
jgi:hypothetical protein